MDFMWGKKEKNNDKSNEQELNFYVMTLKVNEQLKQIKIFKNSNASELAFNFCRDNNQEFSTMKYLKKCIKEIIRNFYNIQKNELEYLLKEKNSVQEAASEEINTNNLSKFVKTPNFLMNSRNMSKKNSDTKIQSKKGSKKGYKKERGKPRLNIKTSNKIEINNNKTVNTVETQKIKDYPFDLGKFKTKKVERNVLKIIKGQDNSLNKKRNDSINKSKCKNNRSKRNSFFQKSNLQKNCQTLKEKFLTKNVERKNRHSTKESFILNMNNKNKNMSHYSDYFSKFRNMNKKLSSNCKSYKMNNSTNISPESIRSRSATRNSVNKKSNPQLSINIKELKVKSKTNRRILNTRCDNSFSRMGQPSLIKKSKIKSVYGKDLFLNCSKNVKPYGIKRMVTQSLLNINKVRGNKNLDLEKSRISYHNRNKNCKDINSFW